MNKLLNNIFIALMITTACVGYDIAHKPHQSAFVVDVVKAQAVVVATPTPIIVDWCNQPNLDSIKRGLSDKYIQVLPNDTILKKVYKESCNMDVPMEYVLGILFTESGYNPNALSKDKNDRGIAQINRWAHPEIIDAEAFDSDFAINWMVYHLTTNRNYFGNWDQAIEAYNVGRGGVTSNPVQAKIYLNAVKMNLK